MAAINGHDDVIKCLITTGKADASIMDSVSIHVHHYKYQTAFISLGCKPFER